jgi:xanthine dehydrogenase YagS FAD-binding subunit
MLPFAFQRAASAQSAVQAAARASIDPPDVLRPVQFLAGGTTLIDLMKLQVMQPDTVIDINRLQQQYGQIAATSEGLRLGALVRMADAAEHEDIKRDYPVIAQALALAASQQVRNMASLGGNLLQRTRCTYFRDVSWAACNKRNPGSGCAALEGFNRAHAVLGVSDRCIATYPGDLAQALIALDAQVETLGPNESRTLPLDGLHRLPEDGPERETVLLPGELITAILVPGGPWTRRSLYLKIRDRESYEFALASAAVALDMDGGTVRTARIGLGGLATVPWRAREAEAALAAKALDEASATAAADAAFAGARGFTHNSFKIALGKQTLVRALLQAGAMEI